MADGSTTGMSGLWAKIKAHPNVTALVVFGVGAVLIYLYYSTGSAAAATDPNAAADQAAVQSEAVQAQYSATLQAQQTQAQSIATQVNGQISIAQITAAAQNDAIAQAGSIASQSIAASETLGLAGIAAGQAINLGSIGAIENLASLQATEAEQANTNLYGYLNNQIASSNFQTVTNDQARLFELMTEGVNNVTLINASK